MARYDREQVQRIRFGVESTFETDLTGDVGANFDDIRHMTASILPDNLEEDDTTVRQNFFDDPGVVHGPERGTLELEAYLTASNEALDDSTSPTKTAQSTFHEALMGGYNGDQGSTVEASPSPTTTGFTVATGEGSRFAEGQVAFVTVSGVDYPVLVTDISTDALTTWPALPSAPATGAAVYNSQTIYLDEDDESSLQFLFETRLDRGDIWLLLGAQGNLELTLNREGLMTWKSTLNGSRRLHDDEISTPQGGSALGVASYDGTSPLFGTVGGLHFGPSATSTRNLVRVSDLTIDTGISWQMVPDHSGEQGIGGWAREIAPISVSLTVLQDSTDGTYEAYYDAYKAGTDYGLLWWAGTSAGSIVSMAAPTMQFAEAPKKAYVDGKAAVELSMRVLQNTQTGAVANALQRSPFVLAT